MASPWRGKAGGKSVSTLRRATSGPGAGSMWRMPGDPGQARRAAAPVLSEVHADVHRLTGEGVRRDLPAPRPIRDGEFIGDVTIRHQHPRGHDERGPDS